MKLFVALVVMTLVGCASCDREEEDFTPFPGGKFDETPLAFFSQNP